MQRRTSLFFLCALSTATAAIGATTYPQPLPSGFSPTSGPPGTVITVTGTGFTGLSAVWIGNGRDATVYVVNDSLIKITVPADATTAHLGFINPQKSEFTSTNFTVTKGSTPSPTPTPPAGGAASISGAVIGTADAAVILSGNSTRVANAGANGSYVFSGVTDGTYTLAPTTAGHVFTPSSVAAKVTGAAVKGVNFNGTPSNAPTYRLSGTVSGAVSANVLLTLNGRNIGSAATDQGGTYSFSGLPRGTYTVGASLAGHTFSAAKSVALGNTDITENNFTSVVSASEMNLALAAVNPLPQATAGKGYSASVLKSVSGGRGAYHYQTGAFATGTPPIGMIMHGNGVLSGTPATPGRYTFELCAADASGAVTTNCAPTTLTVLAASTSAPTPPPTPPSPPSPPTPPPTPPSPPTPPTPPSPPTPPPTPPVSAGTSWIYYNGVFDWPGDWPFVAATDYTDTSGAPLSGPHDLKITLQGQYGGWIPWAANFDFNSAGYTKLTIALKPTEANQGWTLGFVRVGDVPVGIYLDLSNYGPTPVAGQWGVYTIPLADLGVLGQPIYKFVLQDSTGNTGNVWYVDNVGFVP